MYPMDVDTWGEILDAELERKAEKLPRSYNLETLKLKWLLGSFFLLLFTILMFNI